MTINSRCKQRLVDKLEQLLGEENISPEGKKQLEALKTDSAAINKVLNHAKGIYTKWANTDPGKPSLVAKNTIKELMEDLRLSAQTLKRSAMLTAEANEALMRRAEAVDYRPIKIANMVGDRTHSSQLTHETSTSTLLQAKLKQQGLLKEFSSGIHDAQVMNQLHTQEFNEDSSGKIARIVNDVNTHMVELMRRAGIEIQSRKDYVTKTSHNPVKMMGLTPRERVAAIKNPPWKNIDGGEKLSMREKKNLFMQRRWVDAYMENLDLEATFGADVDENLSPEKRQEEYRKRLNRDYLEAVGRISRPKANTAWDLNDGHSQLTESFKRRSSFAARVAGRKRTYVYKSGESQLNVQKRFGAGSLAESMQSAITSTARNLAIVEEFGPNAEHSFDKFKERLNKVYSDESNQMDEKKREDELKKLDTVYDNLLGKYGDAGSYKFARIAQMARFTAALLKQGKVAASALMDPLNQFHYCRRLGESLAPSMRATFRSFGLLARGQSKKLLSEHEKNVLESFKMLHEGSLASIGRFADPTNVQPGRMAKLMDLFYSFNGLKGIDHGLEYGSVLSNARMMAKLSATNFDELPTGLKTAFNAYGLSEHEWNFFRQFKKAGTGNRHFLTPDLMQNASKDQIKDYIEATKNYRPTRLSDNDAERIKDGLIRDYIGFYHDQTKYMVLRPSAVDIATRRKGQGTGQGEAAALFMQFKSWGINYAKRIVLQRLQEARGDRKAFMSALVELMGGTVASGVALGYVDSLLNNEPAPDPTKVKTYFNAFMPMFGLAGSWATTLIEHPVTFGAQVAGPVVGLATQAAQYANNQYKFMTDDVYRSRHTQAGLAYNFWKHNDSLLSSHILGVAMAYGVAQHLLDQFQPGYYEDSKERSERLRGLTPNQ